MRLIQYSDHHVAFVPGYSSCSFFHGGASFPRPAGGCHSPPALTFCGLPAAPAQGGAVGPPGHHWGRDSLRLGLGDKAVSDVERAANLPANSKDSLDSRLGQLRGRLLPQFPLRDSSRSPSEFHSARRKSHLRSGTFPSEETLSEDRACKSLSTRCYYFFQT